MPSSCRSCRPVDVRRRGNGRTDAALCAPCSDSADIVERRRVAPLAVAGLVLACFIGCGRPATEKTDAELGLNAQQSAGRAIYTQYCVACHPAYSSSGDKGPGLKGLFKKQFLPSGLPANDRFVSQTIRMGRGMMPPMGDALSESQLADLLAYLHTL
jgi:mono/diheme cytochrome c family protein